MAYILGQTVRMSAIFRNDLGQLADPDSVSLTIDILDSPANKRSATPAHDSLGHYHFDLQTAKTGTYRHHWEGRSTDLEAVAEDTFRVMRED